MTTESKQELASRVAGLEATLNAGPAGETRTRALELCERLRTAILNSHQEGIRFAAFTLGRVIDDPDAGSPDVRSSFEQLKMALVAAGYRLQH